MRCSGSAGSRRRARRGSIATARVPSPAVRFPRHLDQQQRIDVHCHDDLVAAKLVLQPLIGDQERIVGDETCFRSSDRTGAGRQVARRRPPADSDAEQRPGALTIQRDTCSLVITVTPPRSIVDAAGPKETGGDQIARRESKSPSACFTSGSRTISPPARPLVTRTRPTCHNPPRSPRMALHMRKPTLLSGWNSTPFLPLLFLVACAALLRVAPCRSAGVISRPIRMPID